MSHMSEASIEAQNADKHHELGPSSLKYVEVCPGFRSTNEENVFTIEGTLLHKAAETEDMAGLSEEQETLVAKALAYVKKIKTKGMDMLTEQQLDIRLGDDEPDN